MGCRSSTLLVIPEHIYVDITRELIMNDGTEKDKLERLNNATFRVLQMVQLKNLYSKKDREIIDELFLKVKEKQLKEERKRTWRKSILAYQENRRLSAMDSNEYIKKQEKHIVQSKRINKVKDRNITL